MNFNITNCATLILAAGQSSRLGSPKQLLDLNGTTLLQKTIDITLETGQYPIFVVLGAYAEQIKNHLTYSNIIIIENQNWREGMSSSIKKGIETIKVKFPEVDGLLITVCDQPFLKVDILNELISLQAKASTPAAACWYADRVGTPAIFHVSLFNQLLGLTGDKGAGNMLNEMKNKVAKLSFTDGVVDIDTKEDYEKLISKN